MARRPSYPGQKPPVLRRVIKVVAGLLVTVLLLGAAIVLVDMGLRDFAETRAESEIKRRLPAGSTSPEVTIGGFSFLQQAVFGSLDEVDLEFGLTGEALTTLATEAGLIGAIEVTDATVRVSSQIEVLGIAVPYTVSLEPSLDAGYLVLTATAIEAAGSPELDLTQFVQLGSLGARFCTASLLPESITLTGVKPSGDTLAISALGTGVPVDLDALQVRGTCDDGAEVTEEGAAPAA